MTSITHIPGGSLLTRSNGRLFAIAFAAVAVILLGSASSGWAYQEIRGDLGQANPCQQAGIGDNGGAAKRVYKDPNNPLNPVTVTLLCSDKREFPTAVALSVNDWRGGRQTFTGRGGGIAEPGVIPSYLHGDIADALRNSDFRADQQIISALVGGGIGLTSALATSLIVCAVGGIPTLGIACAGAAAAAGGAVVAAIVSGGAAVVKNFVTAQANRYDAAANAKWFVWMDKWGMVWNSEAAISDTQFNTSMSNARPCVNFAFFKCDPMHAQIGVQFTNAPAGGGPDFFDIKSSGTLAASAQAELDGLRARAAQQTDIGEQIDSLNFNHGILGIHPAGRHRVRTGNSKANRLRGGKGGDTLQGRSGNDRLLGRRGRDTMLGGKGDDQILAGRGQDHLSGGGGNDRLVSGGGINTLLGGGGSNTLIGGRGSDTLVDWGAASIVKTGSPKRGHRAFVNVRDGDDHDVVVCGSERSTVFADAGDEVEGDCGRLLLRGQILKPKGKKRRG
jgi:hypothetical protein